MELSSLYLFGDSIGRGIVFDESRGRYVIARESCARELACITGAKVENLAKMGATVRDGLEALSESQLLPGGIAAIEFGGNDCDLNWKEIASSPEGTHPPKVLLEDFYRGLLEFVEKVRALGLVPVLVTPPPLDAQRFFNFVTKGLNAGNVLKYLGDVMHIYRWQERYSNKVRQAAQSTGAKLFDLRDAFLSRADFPSLLCIDGMHPNEKGQKFMAEAAVEAFALA